MLVDDTPAPIVSAGSAEVVALVPNRVRDSARAKLRVEYRGASTLPVELKVEPAAPGIFLSTPGHAAALNEDGSLNAIENPASTGSVVSLFLTGAGLTNPMLDDGVAGGIPSAPTALPVAVQLGARAAEVLFAGGAPGLVGVTQINVRVPTGVAGDLDLVVKVGGFSRPQAARISVRP